MQSINAVGDGSLGQRLIMENRSLSNKLYGQRLVMENELLTILARKFEISLKFLLQIPNGETNERSSTIR